MVGSSITQPIFVSQGTQTRAMEPSQLFGSQDRWADLEDKDDFPAQARLPPRLPPRCRCEGGGLPGPYYDRAGSETRYACGCVVKPRLGHFKYTDKVRTVCNILRATLHVPMSNMRKNQVLRSMVGGDHEGPMQQSGPDHRLRPMRRTSYCVHGPAWCVSVSKMRSRGP